MNKQVNDIDQEIKNLQDEKNAIIKAKEQRSKASQATKAKLARAAIDKLTAEYNTAEAAQLARLKQIFNLVKKGKGYKRVQFTNDLWVNCWNNPDRLDDKAHINRLEQSIVEIIPGS